LPVLARSRKITPKVWRLDTLKNVKAEIAEWMSTGSSPPPLVHRANRLDGVGVEGLDVLALAQVIAALDVLVHHQSNEVLVVTVVVVGELHQLFERIEGG